MRCRLPRRRCRPCRRCRRRPRPNRRFPRCRRWRRRRRPPGRHWPRTRRCPLRRRRKTPLPASAVAATTGGEGCARCEEECEGSGGYPAECASGQHTGSARSRHRPSRAQRPQPTHLPETQCWLGAQALPQPPQLASSPQGLTQPAAQQISPPLQSWPPLHEQLGPPPFTRHVSPERHVSPSHTHRPSPLHAMASPWPHCVAAVQRQRWLSQLMPGGHAHALPPPVPPVLLPPVPAAPAALPRRPRPRRCWCRPRPRRQCRNQRS